MILLYIIINRIHIGLNMKDINIENKDSIKLFDQFNHPILKVNKKYIYVIFMPYAYNPEDSFQRSIKIMSYLRSLGLTLFSPIIHFHQYHKECQKINLKDEEDYYKWDLEIYAHFKKMIAVIPRKDWKLSNGINNELKWCREHKIPWIFIVE